MKSLRRPLADFCKFGVISLTIVAGFLPFDPAQAQTSSWNNGIGNFNDPTKWDNGVPGSSTDAYITNLNGGTGYAVTWTNTFGTIDSLHLSYLGSGSNVFEISASTRSVTVNELIEVGSNSIFRANGGSITGTVHVLQGGYWADNIDSFTTASGSFAGSLTNDGTVLVKNGVTSTKNWGSIINRGQFVLAIPSGTTALNLAMAGSLVLGAGSTLIISNAGTATAVVLENTVDPVVTNAGTLVLHSPGAGSTGGAELKLGASSTGGTNTLHNVGILSMTTAAGGGTREAMIFAHVLNDVGGIFEVHGGGTSIVSGVVSDPATITNRGTLTIDPGATLSVERVHFLNDTGGAAIVQGRLIVGGPAVNRFRNAGVLSNLGFVTTAVAITNVASGSIFSRGTFQNTLVNQGSLRFLGGTSVISGTLYSETNSLMTAASDARLELSGDFNSRITSNSLFNMTAATIAFNSGLSITQKYEVTGLDVGTNLAGFASNFALGGLSVNGAASNTLQLANAFGSGDALYVQDVILGAGNRLVISNEITLYYLNFTGNEADVILGTNAAFVQIIPESSALLLLLMATGFFCRSRR